MLRRGGVLAVIPKDIAGLQPRRAHAGLAGRFTAVSAVKAAGQGIENRVADLVARVAEHAVSTVKAAAREVVGAFAHAVANKLKEKLITGGPVDTPGLGQGFAVGVRFGRGLAGALVADGTGLAGCLGDGVVARTITAAAYPIKGYRCVSVAKWVGRIKAANAGASIAVG